MLREPMDQISGFVETEGREMTAGDAAAVAVAVHGIVGEAEQMLFPPVITFESVQLQDEESEDEAAPASQTLAVFLFILPGISVWALFLVGDSAMRDLLVESSGRTLRRQLVCPVPPWQIVVGKALYTAVLAGISLIILTLIGWLAAPGGVDVVGFVVLSLAVVLAVTGYSAAVYGVARTENQGATFSGVALLVFAFLGGSFMPLDNLPAAVRQVSPYTPFYWGSTGYNELIVRGGGLGDIWTNVGVLSVLGTVALSVGAVLMNRKVTRGATR
jgi:ABC-type multidrug transport system permease subunit